LAGTLLQTPLGKLTSLPQIPLLDLRAGRGRKEKWGDVRERRKGKQRAEGREQILA